MSGYSQILENVFWPLHNLVKGRHYAEYRRKLETSQWWPAEQLRDFQWRELSRLLDAAFASVPYYREKYAAAGIRRGDIRGWDDYAKLPPLGRSEITANRERLRNAAFPGKLLPHATGGSSGVPTRFYITIDSFDWRSAATQRAYSWTGCRVGEPAVYLWGAPVGTPPRWKAVKLKLYHRLQGQLMFNTFEQTDALWERVLEGIERHRARFLVGYVSSLEGFSEYLLRTGRRIPPVRAVIAAAEPVFPRTREHIESALKAPLFNTYGSREFMSIGGECERHNGLHINAENIVLETQSPGEPSAVLVTDLHNFGMPFLRYEIGDVGVLDDSPCECGRSLPRIRSIEGRILDMLRTSDGRLVPGELFPHVIKEIPEIREFQVRQRSLDHIVLSVVLSAPVSERSMAVLEGEIRKIFGNATRVELQPVESIPRLASGKRRVTIGLS
jgi:phenylacetate-CoA ligase